MPYLVDGNNLLGRVLGKTPRSEEDRSALIRELAQRLRATRARVTLVFDGATSHGAARQSLGALTVRFAGSRTADDLIAETVERAAAASDWYVVTDDRGLSQRVRTAGARVSGVTDFWNLFAAASSVSDAEKPSGTIDEWLDYFADEKNRKL